MFYQTLLFAVIFRCAKSQTVDDFYQLSAVDIHGTKVMKNIFVWWYLHIIYNGTLFLNIFQGWLLLVVWPRGAGGERGQPVRLHWLPLQRPQEAPRGPRIQPQARRAGSVVSVQTEEILQHFSPAFPCNQFGGQEPGTAADIREVAFKRYGARFTVMEKVEVTGPGQHPVWRFLTGEWSTYLSITFIV